MKDRAFSLLTIKAIDEDQRIIRGMASTPEPDRVGDIVEPLGATFGKNLPLLWMHRHDLPVGTVNFGKPTAKGIPFEARLPMVTEPSQLKARIDEAWQSVKAGLIRAVSIGFRAMEYSIIEETGAYRFTKTELYELSLVAVPANSGATILEIKALDSEIRAASGNTDENGRDFKKTSGVSEKKHVKVSLQTKENKQMSLAEKLKGFQDELKAKNAKLVQLAEKSATEGATFDESEQEEFDTLGDEIKALEGHITRLQLAQKAALSNARAVPEDAGLDETKALNNRSGVQVKAPEKLEKGIAMARYAMCLVAAKNNPNVAAELAKTHFGADNDVSKILDGQAKGFDVSKVAIAGGTTSHATFASPLVDLYQTFSGDFIDFLRPRTIIGQFGVGNIPSLMNVPFNIRIPGQTAGATANWVGEGAAKPVTNMGFDDVELRWAKIAAISVITEELVRFSSPSAERLVRDELARAVIEKADVDFIDPAKPASGIISPASITYGVSGIASTGTDADAIRCDIQALWAPFIAANNPPRNAVYIMSSTTALALSMMQNPLGQSEFPGLTMNGGTFLGVPAIVSDYIPVDSAGHMLILVNASDILLADDGQVTLDASREATIQMDTVPTQSVGTPTATTGVSMFQTNSVAIRAERYINWGKRRASAVQYLTGVNYQACT